MCIYIYLFAIALCFHKKPELNEIPRRKGSLLRCYGELNLSLGLKYLGPLCVAEKRMQVQSWEPGSPEKHSRDQELLGGFCAIQRVSELSLKVGLRK